ncbi:MAG: methionyl-tRNA formyltransferase [Patescibacteria group bacterium]|jgi:methionyl-tRNA formyltransferase
MSAPRSNSNKIIFITFNRLGCLCLETIARSGVFDIKQVYTLKQKLTEKISDYKDVEPLCEKFKFSVKRIKNINNEIDEIRKINPDIIFIIGWSQIINRELIKIPKIGCVGFHPALLPKNRGRAAIPWHFINEERYGGATLFFIDDSCDSGDIIGQKKFRLTDKDNAQSYYLKAEEAAVALLNKTLAGLAVNKIKRRPQDDRRATYLLIRNAGDSFLDFQKLNTRQIFNQVRAVAGVYPPAFADYENNRVEFLAAAIVPKKYYIYSATTGQIIKVSPDCIWVKTINGIIELNKISSGGAAINDCSRFFKAGHYLNR